jgi:hypothetical protein
MKQDPCREDIRQLAVTQTQPRYFASFAATVGLSA